MIYFLSKFLYKINIKIIKIICRKFWKINKLEFNLPSSYQDAYEEVERKTISGHIYSIDLKDWVKEYIRNQLSCMIIIYPNLVRKAKNLSVRFYTDNDCVNTMNFYIYNDNIYFESDEMIKREKLLNKLGI